MTELLRLLRQDTTVAVENIGNDVFFDLFLSGQSSATIFH